jgi:glutaredoxin domain-containing cysteine-rich protein 1
LEFREELWRIMGDRVIPPRLFIKGRYIGGADEVTGLHEQGKLKNLLAGIPLNLSNCPCTGCGNIRFIVCSDCNGSRKVFADDQNDETYIRCPECNENGLVKCLICS